MKKTYCSLNILVFLRNSAFIALTINIFLIITAYIWWYIDIFYMNSDVYINILFFFTIFCIIINPIILITEIIYRYYTNNFSYIPIMMLILFGIIILL